MTIEPLIEPTPNPFRVGEAAQTIIRAALHLHAHFVLAVDHAAPRFRAFECVAGPWQKNEFTREVWNDAAAIILAESFEAVLEESSMIRSYRVTAKHVDGDEPPRTHDRPLRSRPSHSFSLRPWSKKEEVDGGGKPKRYVPAVRCHLPGWDRDGKIGREILEIAFDSRTSNYASASHNLINLGPGMIDEAKIPKESRTREWLCHSLETFAHELAHVWQLENWKTHRLTVDAKRSVGGDEAHASPHSARLLEPFANACGHAAFYVGMGKGGMTEKERVAQLARPGTCEREMLVDWKSPEFVEAFPREAHAAALYRRFFKMFVPVFEQEFALRKPW